MYRPIHQTVATVASVHSVSIAVSTIWAQRVWKPRPHVAAVRRDAARLARQSAPGCQAEASGVRC
jgi:hypothetical protein